MKDEMNKPVSKCCGASIKVGVKYVCMQCGESCDIAEDKTNA